VAEWDLPITPDEYLDGFRDWLSLPSPGAEELVEEVAGVVTVGCLSNTNPVHWVDRASRWPMMASFEFRLLSFELGLLKPDRDIFEHVVTQIGVPAAGILFLDDNLLNVDAAIDVGLQAVRVRGVDEARQALVAAGVL
jgi:HAD superfamily hydrolase (TIGR01509 family)